MLSESISIPAGGGKGDGREESDLLCPDGSAGADMTFPDGKLSSLNNGGQFIPVVQEQIHGIGDIGVNELYIIEEFIDQDSQLFGFFFEIRYQLHRIKGKGKIFRRSLEIPSFNPLNQLLYNSLCAESS
jgi:hypothetical protein